jgi:hypothetical protein
MKEKPFAWRNNLGFPPLDLTPAIHSFISHSLSLVSVPGLVAQLNDEPNLDACQIT